MKGKQQTLMLEGNTLSADDTHNNELSAFSFASGWKPIFMLFTVSVSGQAVTVYIVGYEDDQPAVFYSQTQIGWWEDFLHSTLD